MMVSVRQYISHTSKSVEEIRRHNADLQELFDLAGGLAARAHDSAELRAYAETRLSAMLGAEAHITAEPAAGSIPLLAGQRDGRMAGALLRRDGRRAVAPPARRARPAARDGVRERPPRRRGAAVEPRSHRSPVTEHGGEGLLHRWAHRACRRGSRSPSRRGSATRARSSRRSRSEPSSHDIGKIGIPEAILNKPGPLSDAEWEDMKEHPVISDYILADINVHPIVRQIARWSHERLDGKGYPDGLEGDMIPEPARIVLVADAFDALTTNRVTGPGARRRSRSRRSARTSGRSSAHGSSSSSRRSTARSRRRSRPKKSSPERPISGTPPRSAAALPGIGRPGPEHDRLGAREVDHRRRRPRQLSAVDDAAATPRRISGGTSASRLGSGSPGRLALVATIAPTVATISPRRRGRRGDPNADRVRAPARSATRTAAPGSGTTSVYGPGRSARAAAAAARGELGEALEQPVEPGEDHGRRLDRVSALEPVEVGRRASRSRRCTRARRRCPSGARRAPRGGVPATAVSTSLTPPGPRRRGRSRPGRA